MDLLTPSEDSVRKAGIGRTKSSPGIGASGRLMIATGFPRVDVGCDGRTLVSYSFLSLP